MVFINNKPIVSIGLPVFNGERYLKQTIESITEQTFSNFELIISDNNSNDSTSKICKEFTKLDKRIKYYKQRNNNGFWDNYKFVLEKSIGEYFIWIAHDDLQNKKMISELVKILEENKEVVLATCDIQNINEDGLNTFIQKIEQIRLTKSLKNKMLNTIYFFRNPTSSIYNSFYGLYRHKSIKNIDLNYGGILKYATGWEIPFLAQVSLKGSIISIPLPYKKYRRHSKSMYHSESQNKGLIFHLINRLNISQALLLITISSPKNLLIKFILILTVAYDFILVAPWLIYKASNKLLTLLIVIIRQRIYNLRKLAKNK